MPRIATILAYCVRSRNNETTTGPVTRVSDKIPPSHPYESLPPRAFWRKGVVDDGGAGLSALYAPSVPVTADTRIATAGSCFAQHIGRWLRKSGVTVLDAEPAPPMMPDDLAHKFGYRLFSGRYGNIYTARQLRQLLEEIINGRVDGRFVWEIPNGRYVDAFRPTVEPEGLETAAEVLLHRDYHLEKTAQILRTADIFVFTLGLAEAWEDAETGRVFPVCPGVAGGQFSETRHKLRQFRYGDVAEDLSAIRALLHRFNPEMGMLLTVSPVPLTATATGNHVLTATTAAKATLRAAAGDFAADHGDVDYVPSFELITSHATGGPWFAPNMRSVTAAGVEMVMSRFLAAHGLQPQADPPRPVDASPHDDEDDLVCDELLLQARAG